MSKVTIETADNGFIVTTEGLTGKTRVFPKIEEALQDAYQAVSGDWNVGDRVTVKRGR